MEADFSGYATKAELKCSDGRIIMPDAFKHQDTAKVPLVWQHGHTTPENVLGHVLLENRKDGVYCYAYFNKSTQAEAARELVEHGDINSLSIWANELIEKSKRVLHGVVREVSLVLSGANPGALIDSVTIRHADGEDIELEDEAIIYTGLELEHSSPTMAEKVEDKEEAKEEEKQEEKEEEKAEDKLEHKTDDKDETLQDVIDSMNPKQQEVLHYMVGQAMESVKEELAEHSNTNDNKEEEGNAVKHNVFEDEKTDEKEVHVLSHDAMRGIVDEAQKGGSLRDAVQGYALAHGIQDIDILFPDAKAVDNVPEFLKRRTEWVGGFLGAARKSPFSRIKTFSADLTEDEARAKGYIKGNLKKEEFFQVSKRVTTPTTVYKKQKLDRDDMIDITDFDVVAWLKGEMRLMLDEEIARAGLMGDGRDIASEDKINEQNIRPIATDHELFVTTLSVNLGDANSSIQEFIDVVVTNRSKYKGTGLPTMYTTETYIAKFLLLRDTLGRSIYRSLDEVATALRVSSIVPVEVMEEDPTLVAILVNPVDYVFGATRGGEVSMFDDFDIDYNQQKYLIETRLCGALTKLKSAIVVRSTPGNSVLVAPVEPTYDDETGEIVITNTTGVVYKNALTNAVLTNGGSPYVVPEDGSITVVATPGSGYHFATSDDDEWTYNR